MKALHFRAAVVTAGVMALLAACAGPGAPIGPGIPPQEGGATGGVAGTAGVLAFLVQPHDIAAGSPINPEVKVEALDTLGDVLTEFAGTVRVALGTRASGGSLSGTTSVAATAGVAFFDTLVINQAGNGYTLVASAPGFGSVASAPFTVFGAMGSAVRAP